MNNFVIEGAHIKCWRATTSYATVTDAITETGILKSAKALRLLKGWDIILR